MAKKIFLIAILSLFSLHLAAFEGGNGTQASPYLISNEQMLKDIPNDTEAWYELTSDIPSYNLSACEYKVFKGHFNGNGHIININAKVNDFYGGSSASYLGLFGGCIGAEISNLTIRGAVTLTSQNSRDGSDSGSIRTYNGYIYLNWYYTTMYAAAICSYASSSTFTNCHNEAIITASTKDTNNTNMYFGSSCKIGGLVGNATSCDFNNCSNIGSITTFMMSSAFQNWNGLSQVLDPKINHVGGLSGFASNCNFYNCYNRGNIKDIGSLHLLNGGGMYGESTGSKTINCYSSGELTTLSRRNPLGIGDNSTTIKDSFGFNVTNPEYLDEKYENCFFDGNTGNKTGLKEVAKEMFSIATWYDENLPSWDFAKIWYLPSEVNSLPDFRKKPIISYTGVLKYGESITFESSNKFTPLRISPTNPQNVIIDGATVKFLSAGIHTLRLKQDLFSDFMEYDESIIVNVAKANLVISAIDSEIEYGSTPILENNISYSGFIDSDDATDLTKMPKITCGANAKSDVGSYNVVVSDAESYNYNISYKNGILKIVPKTLYVTPIETTRRYGSSNPSIRLSFDGFVNGNNESLIIEYPTTFTTANELSSVGEYVITCAGGSVYKNYKFGYNTGKLTIEKASLTIKVGNYIREVGTFNPDFNLIYEGFKNNDSQSDLDELPIVSCDADIFSPAGVYPIHISGGSDKNYEYNLIDGQLLVKESSDVNNMSDIDSFDIEFFNLQGIKVDRPKPGNIYIRRVNGKVTKVFVK